MFGFDATTEVSNGGGKFLKGDAIHEVKFKGCSFETIEKKDGSGSFDVFKLKFENENGSYEHSLYGPDKKEPNKFMKRSNPWGPDFIPSQYEVFSNTVKHCINAIAPELGKLIDARHPETIAKLNKPNFKEYCEAIIEILSEYIDVETSIKLIKDKKGYATFPKNSIKLVFKGNEAKGIKADFKKKITEDVLKADNKQQAESKAKSEAITPTVQCVLWGNFIGDGLSWSAYELKTIKERAEAKPTDMSSMGSADPLSLDEDLNNNDHSDLDVSFDDL